MRKPARIGFLAVAAALAVAACGKKTDADAPIAFVPADTPYVVAALEPVPEATAKQLAARAQAVWANVFPVVDQTIAEISKKAGEEQSPEDRAAAEKGLRVLKALFDEMRGRDTPEKWREVGLGTQARSAIYGVGLLPVARLEIVDADALRAMIARIEQKSGTKLDTARIGEQDVWTFGNEQVLGLMAIEGKHFVVTAVPAGADETLKRRVLGLDRPARSLADTNALADFNKARGYLPYASGWLDTRRLLAAFADGPEVALFAAASGETKPELDATCRAEFDALLAKVPLVAFGYTKLDADAQSMHMRVDLDPALAKTLAAVPDALPGKRSDDALFDLAISLPVLRARDFLVAQADAVARAPFQCRHLEPLNASLAEMKTKLDQTIPPPLSDLLGVRVTLDRLVLPAADGSRKLDVAARVLVGSNNPAFLTSLAQMSVPQLRTIQVAADGKAVAIPPDVVPGGYLDGSALHVAMGAKTLGLAVGNDETPKLEAAVTAAPGAGVAIDSQVSGAFYKLLGDAIGEYGNLLPAEQRASLEVNAKLYAMYADWFKRVGGDVRFGADGIDFTQDVEYAAH